MKPTFGTKCGTIVEFIGIPGSGKSYLASALARKLSREHDVALPKREEYRRTKLTLSEKLRLDFLDLPGFLTYRARRLAYDIGKRGRPGFWTVRDSWSRSRYPLVLLDRIRSAPKQYYVLDEWLVHNTIDESIRRYSSAVSFVEAFALARMRKHRLVYVYLHVDLQLARERILNADNAFRYFARSGNVRIIDEVLGQWDRCLARLGSEIERRGLACIDVDGRDAVESNADRILELLLKTERAPASANTQQSPS